MLALQRGLIDQSQLLAAFESWSRAPPADGRHHGRDGDDRRTWPHAAGRTGREPSLTGWRSRDRLTQIFRPRSRTRAPPIARSARELVSTRSSSPTRARVSPSCGRTLGADSARSSSHTIPSWIVMSRSSSSRRTARLTRSASHGFSGRRRSPAGWSIQGSCRCTDWAVMPTGVPTTRCGSSRARP